ncbi:MAG TPA: GNAT family N-acetyltransferase [Flavobacterium sp.]|uniref:GNAT family N-acetyltransferase n=1 Tax=Flavobacterium sp. TaxID=239 RepID=UPI002DBF3B79|nr:GNAT family N-acetyltransferase [Flavobacterium sp.]HEU4788456.1 GNAT family N-acetyltransferase [Flavobacterium sp.]
MSESDFNLQPDTLENDQIKIIPLKENDFEILYKVASDPEIWEQHPSKNRYQKDVFQLFFDGAVDSKSAFLVYNSATEELIGSTRYYDFDAENSKIAIGFTFLAKKFWGGNHNKAMKQLLIDYAFEHVDTIVFHIGKTNIRSQKAVSKIGATKMGIVDFNNIAHFEYHIQKKDWV